VGVNELVLQLQEVYVLLDDGDRRALRHVGLTPTQFALLRCIDESAGRELQVGRLAEVMLCTRGNATRLVKRLEEGGLVRTRSDARDQRLVLVAITAEGERRLANARTQLDAANARRLRRMPDRDLRALAELIGSLADALAKDLAELDDAAPREVE
jgi:MarR family 2-MHQ and catechol resistance regulon transcriptional repressor